MLWMLGELDSSRSLSYQLLVWVIVILFGAWFLGLLAVRLIRMVWARRYQDDVQRGLGSRSRRSTGESVDPWQEAGRRMEAQPPEPPERPGFPDSPDEY